MINKFIHWLMDPPSLKGLRESTQHGYQVYKIWIDMSPDLKVQQLLDVKKLHVWLDTFLKTMAPGTAKSYLSSLTIFIDFLVNRLGKRDQTSFAILRRCQDVQQKP